MTKTLALEGQRFGRLVVVRRGPNDKHGKTQWVCACDCGEEKVAATNNLIRNKTTSCGCKRLTALGMSDSSEYKTYMSMLNRCYNSKHTSYRYYGAKGVSVCDRWNPAKKGSFENFIQDMGLKPSPNHQLDKDIKVKGSLIYSPKTCAWVSAKINSSYKSNNRIVSFQGRSYTVSELAQHLSMSPQALFYRISRGWPESRWDEPLSRAPRKRSTLQYTSD